MHGNERSGRLEHQRLLHGLRKRWLLLGCPLHVRVQCVQWRRLLRGGRGHLHHRVPCVFRSPDAVPITAISNNAIAVAPALATLASA